MNKDDWATIYSLLKDALMSKEYTPTAKEKMRDTFDKVVIELNKHV